MKLKLILLVAACLALPSANADTSVPDINTLRGPSTSTPLPAEGDGAPTDPATTAYTTGTSSRLSLYVPGTIYEDYPGWLALYKALVFQGIPVKVTKNITEAITHPTVLAYQALQSKYMGSTDGTTWKNYVNAGHTLIAIGLTSTDSNLKSVFGVTPDTTTNKNKRKVIALNPPLTAFPASKVNAQFDQSVVNDVQIPLWAQYYDSGFDTIGYKPSAGVCALGSYLLSNGKNDTEQAITIKSTSNGGHAVAIGVDVGTYVGQSNSGSGASGGIPRAYDTTYDPGYDTFFRIIKYLYSTSTTTGLVTSWGVPGNKGVHFAWTYDIDAQDSYSYAYNVSLDLQSRGIKGTVNWQAKLVKDSYDIASFSAYYRNISRVEALGNMELASHSISHSPNLNDFPIGTGKEIWDGAKYDEDNYFPFIEECVNTTGVWNTTVPGATPCTPLGAYNFFTTQGTLFGETRVSKFILESISIVGATVRSFRTGHLLFPTAFPQILESVGYKYSSSSAANDQNTHMPFQPFYNSAYNQEVDLIEFPLSASDEDGEMNGDFYAPGTGGYVNGSYAWNQYQCIQKQAKYGTQYTFLLHPTTHAVPGLAPSTFENKLAFQQTLTPLVTNVSYFDTMGGRGDFHKARINAGIDVSISGNVATVTVALQQKITDLTLRFPTAWSFKSSTVAVNTATPGAVILVNTVSAGTVTLKFQTSGTATATTNPSAGPASTTTTISMASPTIPAPTPTPTNPLMVDDFVDPSRYSSGSNALGFYTDDDNTMTERTSVQADWLLLNFDTSSYWYTLLGEDNTCNDYSKYSSLNLAVRYPYSSPIGFTVVLQTNDAATCTQMTQYPFSVTSLVNSATPGSDGWLHISVPLSSYTGADLTSMKAITIAGFPTDGTMEIDYLYFS
ncbi:hypothetical protein BGX21_010238 [Mortierella sp. AD011]|nr:hypothetical protein BGX20_002135 [Mortierella sp. AD010]KAF9394738.1 hypothetical protein BGX21_010238 [Mortierella sp. AD011]